MSKIDMADVLENEPGRKKKGRKKQTLIPKKFIIIFAILCVIFGSAIIMIVNNLVNLPFQVDNRNLSVVVQDSVNVAELKIDQVRRSFLLILPNSFWDHTNFTDIDYSNKTIGLAVNNVLGYDMKSQNWSYKKSEDGVSQIVSVNGKLTLDNVKYEANIQFNIVDDHTFFYDLQLKEAVRRAKFLPATPKQKSMLIQMMYRG